MNSKKIDGEAKHVYLKDQAQAGARYERGWPLPVPDNWQVSRKAVTVRSQLIYVEGKDEVEDEERVNSFGKVFDSGAGVLGSCL